MQMKIAMMVRDILGCPGSTARSVGGCPTDNPEPDDQIENIIGPNRVIFSRLRITDAPKERKICFMQIQFYSNVTY